VLQSRGEMPVGRAAAMAIPAMPATTCFHCMMVLLLRGGFLLPDGDEVDVEEGRISWQVPFLNPS
jgi:hypothetical protein